MRYHDTISAIPPYPAIWCSQCLDFKRLGATPLPLVCTFGLRWPPCKRGISAILPRYHTRRRQNACDALATIVSREGIPDRGGISHWAAKYFPAALKRQVVLMNTEKMTNFNTPQRKGLLLIPPQTIKMTKMAGVTQAKAWFTNSSKGMLYQ